MLSMEEKAVQDVLLSFVGRTLTMAEASLTEAQFRSFKKLLMSHYHDVVKVKIREVLTGKDHAGAVAK
jgi:hypothetical protein